MPKLKPSQPAEKIKVLLVCELGMNRSGRGKESLRAHLQKQRLLNRFSLQNFGTRVKARALDKRILAADHIIIAAPESAAVIEERVKQLFGKSRKRKPTVHDFVTKKNPFPLPVGWEARFVKKALEGGRKS